MRVSGKLIATGLVVLICLLKSRRGLGVGISPSALFLVVILFLVCLLLGSVGVGEFIILIIVQQFIVVIGGLHEVGERS